MKKALYLALSLCLMAACSSPKSTSNPNGFISSDLSSNSVTLLWESAPNATGYLLERQTGNAGFEQIAELLAEQTSYTDTNLLPETSYSYKLKTLNVEGNSSGVVISITTPAGEAGFNKLGTLSLSETLGGSNTLRAASASFTALDTPLPSIPDTIYGQLPDSCIVSVSDDTEPAPPPDPNPTEPGVNLLDAGDPLSIKAKGAEYATLQKAESPRNISYFTDEDLGPLPEGASITIPGAEFPSFKDVAFPDTPEDFVLSSSTGLSQVNKTSVFTWTGQGSKDSVMTLNGISVLADGRSLTFFCTAKDDNSFSFPASTQAEFDKLGFTTGLIVFANRSAQRSHTKGDAALLLYVNRVKSYLFAE